MRGYFSLAVLVLLAVAWAGGAAGAQGAGSPVYLALGDSLAAGVGASDPMQTGYVNLVYNALQAEAASPYKESGLILLNLGDPGETTTSMLASGDQLEKALADIESRRDDDIAGNEVAVITIDIGANDFIPLVESGSPCLAGLLSDACLEAARSALATFQSNFADIMRRLRSSAGPEVEIVVLGLYNPFSGTGGPFEAVADLAVKQFNGTVAGVAGEPEIQAKLADVFLLFQGKGPQLTHIAELPPDVHPNDSGHYLMAQAVLTALDLAPGAVASPPSASPTSTVVALPATGGSGDDGTPWALYIGLVVVGGVVVATGLLVLVRRRAA